MKESLKFSIIVPVYKVENYLEQCVHSLIHQTYSDIEIILVDDESPDRCPEMCDTFAEQDSRIKVIHQKNGGPSLARNTALEIARGEYIMFVDSDDNIELDTCEKILPFVQMGCDIIIGDGVSEGEKKKLKHGNTPIGKIYKGDEYLKKAYRRTAMPMVVWLYVYKRTFLEENKLRLKNGLLHEDEHFIPRVFLVAEQVVESGICFYHYVIRENSITTRKDLRQNAKDMYTACLELREIYKEVENEELQRLMIDSLAVKYLSLFQQGKLYQYGKEYCHKKFIWENAKQMKTKAKALLFCISPCLYWNINHYLKRGLVNNRNEQ